MSGLFHNLTVRGRCLFAAGVTAGLSGLVLAERDLVRLALLLMCLPIAASWLAHRSQFRLSCVRELSPPRLAAGEQGRVVLRLENLSRVPTGLLLLEDTVPYLLGGRPRVVVDRLAPRRPVDVGYDVQSSLRGRYAIGPVTVRLLDPFGLCEVPRSFSATDTLVVTPAVTPLPAVRLTGEWVGAGDSTARSVATAGEDDAATREYRRGDDLRRIHWRSTARRGELTVRREEQPWQSRAAVLLDGRNLAHAGEGLASSFEWSVSAAASIGIHLSRSGFGVRLVTDTGEAMASDGQGVSFEGVLLDSLAEARESHNSSLRHAVTALRRTGGEGLLVAVVGELSGDDAQQLARLRTGHASVGVVLLLDTESWKRPAGTPADEREELLRCEALLAGSGWRTIVVRQGDELPDLWTLAGQTVAAVASRSMVGWTGAGATR
jgi:uncharacterized protein (DUF58 family)